MFHFIENRNAVGNSGFAVWHVGCSAYGKNLLCLDSTFGEGPWAYCFCLQHTVFCSTCHKTLVFCRLDKGLDSHCNKVIRAGLALTFFLIFFFTQLFFPSFQFLVKAQIKKNVQRDHLFNLRVWLFKAGSLWKRRDQVKAIVSRVEVVLP